MNNTISARYHQGKLPIAIVLYFILKNNHRSFEYLNTVLKAVQWKGEMFLTYWLWQEIIQTAWRINARHGVVTCSHCRLCTDRKPRAGVTWLLKNFIALFECDKQSASKPCQPFRNAFYDLSIRWIQEMNLKGLGSDSSGVRGWSGLSVVLL